MESFLTAGFKKAECHYHKLIEAYHYTLYKDCLNPQMKEKYFKKVLTHQQWPDDLTCDTDRSHSKRLMYH
jgi:hypothetical protein